MLRLQIVQREGALLPMSQRAAETLKRLDNVEAALTQELGRTPDLAQVADKVGCHQHLPLG